MKSYKYVMPLYYYKSNETHFPNQYYSTDELSHTGNTLKVKVGETVLYGLYSALPRTGITQVTPDILKMSDVSRNTSSYFICGDRISEDKVKNITDNCVEFLDGDGKMALFFFNSTDDFREKPKISCANTLNTLNTSLNQFSTIVGGFSGSNVATICYDGDVATMTSGLTKVTTTNINIRKEEKKTMANNIFGNLRTGKAGNNYAITYFGGVSFKNKTYYKGKIYEVDGLTVPFDMLYFIPSTEVKKDDIIEKDGVAYHITEVNKSGTVTAINLVDGKEETLVPGGPFGMSMYSKLFNPFGQMKGDNAFGNMMLMQAMSGNDSGSGNAMMMAMLMSQGGFQLPTFQMPTVDKTKEDVKSN